MHPVTPFSRVLTTRYNLTREAEEGGGKQHDLLIQFACREFH